MATFTNQAILSYNGIELTSNTVTGTLIETVSATKNAITDVYNIGDTVTYTVSLINTDTAAVSSLTVNDNLGAYTVGTQTVYPLTYTAGAIQYYVNGVLQTAPTVTAGPPLVISGISIPAGGNVQLVYSAVVNDYATPTVGGTVTNTAAVIGTALAHTLTASETITVASNAVLEVSKGMNPTSVSSGDTVTYTFTILNSGNTDATASTNVIITDTFNPLLNLTAVTFNGTAWTAGTNYTYDTTTGVFETSTGQVTVPAATFTQSTTGEWTTTPGSSVLVITGTVA